MFWGMRRSGCLSIAILFTLSSGVMAQSGRPGQQRQRPGRAADRLSVGDDAPDFTLKSPDGETATTLSDFEGDKPVALIFGSYT